MTFFQKISSNLKREKLLIVAFRDAGAVSIEMAKDIREIGEFNRSAFNKLVGKSVIENGGGDTFFLSEQGLMKMKMDRVKWAMILLFTFIAFIILVSRTG